VDVVISEDAREYVRAHGGTVFVRAHHHRCCSGPLTLLDLTTEPPTDASGFDSVENEPIEFRFCGHASDGPEQLVIELRGLLRRRPVASWDGCAYRL
jgi:hypothetical protein